jgi:hypothetical protein
MGMCMETVSNLTDYSSGKELPVKYAVKWTRSIDFKCECILWEGMTYNGYFGNLENEFLNKYKQNL